MDWILEEGIIFQIIRVTLDILILAFLIYQIYNILVKTQAIQLVKGAFIMAIIYAFAFVLKLDALLWIMNTLATVVVIIIAIIFQPELRNIFTRIGKGEWFKFRSIARSYHLDSILNAVEVLSDRKRGALIVFSRKVGLKNFIETGTKLNAELSSALILSIFGYNTPLHDGAVVLKGSKIVAAGCFLPLSEQPDIRRSFGTRHRAALGMAEETDAVIIVVSEESGAVSLAYDANLYYDLSQNEMRKTLGDIFNMPEEDNDEMEEDTLFED